MFIFVAGLVGGLLQREFLRYVAFTVLPVAILLNISIFLAHYVANGSAEIIKAGWTAIAVVALLVMLYGFDGKTDSDIWIILTWSMLVLSFPASLLVSLVRMVLPMAIGTSYLSLVTEWAAYFALGHWQWFVLLPWLWRKWKTRRVSGAASAR